MSRLRYRVAIVGTGSIAQYHADALRANRSRVQLVAGVDVDHKRAEAFCTKNDISRPYADTAQMLATERPDLVHICTPPMTHLPLTLQCLEAGSSVLCEKPLCASLADFDALAEAEDRTGCYVSTVFQWRFGSAAQHFKKLITSGELGRPLVGACQTVWFRDDAYYAVPWRGTWANEIGGVTVGHGIHLMDLFLWLYGDWAEVRAMVGSLDRKIQVDDVSMALVRFESGAMGSITNSVLSPRQATYMRLDTQKATIEVSALYAADNSQWSFQLADDSPDEANLERWRSIDGNSPGNHAAQVAAMLDSMDRGERPLVSGLEGRRVLELIASLYKSAFTGQPVTRGSITPGDVFYHSMHGNIEQVSQATKLNGCHLNGLGG